MKGKLLLLMLLIASCASYAQNTTTSSYIVKGILVDSLTLEGEPYATIEIVEKKAPDKAVKMAVTDMQCSAGDVCYYNYFDWEKYRH